jgi:nickel-dependent lactate racemase
VKTIELLSGAWEQDAPYQLALPDDWDIEILGDQPLPALNREQIAAGIRTPVGGPPLADLIQGRTQAAILLDDISRPTPVAAVIEILIEDLLRSGLPTGQIHLVIAGGTHPPATPQEIRQKLGTSLPAGIQVHAHDSRGSCKFLGKSAKGTPIYLDTVVADCDLRIGVGCIYPHPAAGFSGGAKILVPGAAGFETVRILHDNFQGSDRRGGSIDCPFRSEIEAIARQVGLDYVVNLGINQQRQVCQVFSGDMNLAFRRGVQFVRDRYRVHPARPADIIITDVYPFDGDVQFAYDRGLWPIESAPRHTSRVILAACPRGLGSHDLFPAQKSFRTRLLRRLRYFRLSDLKTVGRRLGYARNMLARQSQEVLFVSSGLSEADFKKAFPAGRLFPNWEEAREELIKRHPAPGAKAVIYRCAPLMLPAE